MHNLRKNLVIQATFILGLLYPSTSVSAATSGFADLVLDYFDSGSGLFPYPYGGEHPGGIGFPAPVSLDVVLGNDTRSQVDFLSLSPGSSITLGFMDKVVIDGRGNDLAIREIGANQEQAEVYVSSDLVNFTFLGIAGDHRSTPFDLSTIGFREPVKAVRIVGLDTSPANSIGSPGFDLVNVKISPRSLLNEFDLNQSIPEPNSMLGLLSLGIVAMARFFWRR